MDNWKIETSVRHGPNLMVMSKPVSGMLVNLQRTSLPIFGKIKLKEDENEVKAQMLYYTSDTLNTHHILLRTLWSKQNRLRRF